MKISRSLLNKIHSNADSGTAAKPLSPYSKIILDLTIATAKHLESHQ